MRATDPCPPGESIPVGEANSKPEKVKYAVQEMLILKNKEDHRKHTWEGDDMLHSLVSEGYSVYRVSDRMKM